MTNIAFNQTSLGATSGGTTATTAAKNTPASGSTILALCNFYPGVAAGTPIDDNKGNTYVPLSGITPISAFELLYICENATGGSGHTVTLHLSVSGNPVIIMGAFEGQVLSSILDKHNQAGGDGIITSPYLSGSSGTLSQANELLVIYAESDSGDNPATFAVNSIGATPNTGWTMHEKQENGTTDNCIMMASQRVTATTAAQGAFTSSGSDGFSACYILTFKEASGGGGANNVVTLDEALVVIDQAMLGVQHGVTLTELLVVFDDPNPYKLYQVILDEGLSVIDQLIDGALRGRTVDEALTILDLTDDTRAYSRQLDEGLTVLDETQRIVWYRRVLDEALDVLDQLIVVRSGNVAYVVILDEALVVYDEALTQVLYSRRLDESITIGDQVIVGAICGRTLDDSLVVSEDLLKFAVYTRQLDDSINVLDLADRVAWVTRNIFDTLDVTDLVTSSVTHFQAFTSDAVIRTGVDQFIVTGASHI